MANFGEGFKNIFLAGIGAMAITGERTKELVDQLVAKGELTVEQGKEINSELRHKVEDAAGTTRDGVLEAYMSTMTPEQRADFAAKAAEFAAKANAGTATEVEVEVEVEEVSPAAACEESASEGASPKSDSQTSGE